MVADENLAIQLQEGITNTQLLGTAGENHHGGCIVTYPYSLHFTGQEVKGTLAKEDTVYQVQELGDVFGWNSGVEGRAIVNKEESVVYPFYLDF